jgi:hypothetical protein
MRPALLAGLALAVVPAVGLAQSAPYLAVVADPEVKLRAGPGDKMPITGTLTKDTPVLVDHEVDGWLAVQELPGRVTSVSWVQNTFVNVNPQKPLPQLVEVTNTEGVTLRAGEMGLAQPLHVQKLKVPAGTILRVVGPKVMFEDKGWWPVDPPAGDFRYLPKTAVRYDKPANTGFVVRDVSPPPAAPPASPPGGSGPVAALPGPGAGAGSTPRPPVTPPPAGPATTSSKPAVQHPLWAQAEVAEREGRYDEAEKLYFQLARVMNEPGGDHDIANLCYTRIHSLREKKRNAAPATKPVGAPTRPATGTPTGSGSAPNDERQRWTGPGRLVRSALTLEKDRQTYALEVSPGMPVVYVIAGPGVELDRWANKKVDVYGASYTRRGLTKPYVVATSVEAAP